MPKAPILTLLLLAALPAAGVAQEDRFTLEKTEGGFVRLDRQSGAMSFCTTRDGSLACRMAADERLTFEDELQRLERRVEALEKAAAAARAMPPDDREIDRSISIMERFMRSLMGIIEEFRGRMEGPSPGPPERT